MIELLVGKSGQDISKLIYKDIEKRLKNKEKSILIVPEQYTLETDIDFLDSISYKSVMDAKVLSFSSFTNFILERIGVSDKTFLNREGKLILLTNIIKDLDDELTLFKNSYNNIDFINSLVDLLTSFKDDKLGEEFFDKLKDFDLDDALRIKFKELRLIIKAYESYTKDKYFDLEDITSFVAEKIKDLDFLDGYKFYFDKFDSMEERKIDLIRALDNKKIPIAIGLNIDPSYLNPLSPRPEIFDPAFGFYNKLRKDFEIKLKKLEKSKSFKDLDHLKENFESYKIEVYKNKPENIRVYESISTNSELENMALLINKLIKTKKVYYKDIAVYITDETAYENDLVKVFNRYKIPIFLDKRRRMIDNHLVKTFLALIRLVVDNYRKEDLYYVLNSNLIDFPTDVNSLVNFINYRNIKGKMFEEDKYFDLDLDFYEKYLENDPKKAEKIKDKKKEYDQVSLLRDKLLSILANIDIKEASAKDFATAIYKLISDASIIEGIKKFQERLKEDKDLALYRENSQVWDEFIKILDQLVLIMGHRKTSLSRIYTLIESVCKDTKIGLIPPSKDHLIVTSFGRERISNRPINIVIGLSDSYFPSNNTGDFLISESEKDILKSEGVDLKLYHRDLSDLELLNLYKLITNSSKLILSYSLADKKGAEQNRSYILESILRAFSQMKVIPLSNLKREDAFYSKESSKKYALGKINLLRNGKKLDDFEKDFARSFLAYLKESPLEKNKKTYTDIIKAIDFTNDKAPLSKDTSRGLFSKPAYSVSEVESYSRCPYKHFVGYGLRPEEKRDFDINYMEIGNIIHKSLEDLSSYIKENKLEDIKDSDLDKLLEENFKKGVDLNLDNQRKESKKNTYVLENMLNSAKRNARQIKFGLKKGDFKLDYFEEDFDKGGLFPPVYVDGENYLRGRIDRIDRVDNLVRIIDYKTGNKTFKLVNVLNGLDLQLIVYMIAVGESNKGLVPLGSFYLPLKDEIKKIDGISYSDEKSLEEILTDKFSMTGLLVKINEEVLGLIDNDFDQSKLSVIDYDEKNILSKDDFDKLSDFAKDLLRKLISNIKKGIIDLRPIRESKNKKECSFCPYREICKFDEIIDSTRFRDIDKSRTIKDLEDSYGRD